MSNNFQITLLCLSPLSVVIFYELGQWLGRKWEARLDDSFNQAKKEKENE